jgi:hypothetical protein
MAKKLIRLTENDLHRIVKESVQKILNEIGNTEKGRDNINQAMVNSVHNDIRHSVEQGMPADNGVNKRCYTRQKVHNHLKNGPHGKEWMDGHGKDWLFGDED